MSQARYSEVKIGVDRARDGHASRLWNDLLRPAMLIPPGLVRDAPGSRRRTAGLKAARVRRDPGPHAHGIAHHDPNEHRMPALGLALQTPVQSG